jgi:hypothetical protein
MVTWLQQLLSYLGHTTMTMKDYLETPEAAHLVILDPEAANPGRMAKIGSVLEQTQNRMVVLDSQTEPLPKILQEWELPKIDLFLTQKEIKRYAKARI